MTRSSVNFVNSTSVENDWVCTGKDELTENLEISRALRLSLLSTNEKERCLNMVPNSSFGWKELTYLSIACIIASFASDYVRTFFLFKSHSEVEVEPLMIFLLWNLIIWWVAKRYSGGFSVNWFIFVLLFFSVFADQIDSTIGGELGFSKLRLV